jgi:DNA-binding transcriptional MerR regulator
VSSRTYLSIGDVLTLLREEFPDVTISKIRFLESQGLVNPERSPSGYRKFFDHDVERLRWVLRQQREHFLPLKVIRDRLDAGDIDLDDDSSVGDSVVNGKLGEPADPTADDEAMARILADASRRTALLPDAAGAAAADTGTGRDDHQLFPRTASGHTRQAKAGASTSARPPRRPRAGTRRPATAPVGGPRARPPRRQSHRHRHPPRRPPLPAAPTPRTAHPHPRNGRCRVSPPW